MWDKLARHKRHACEKRKKGSKQRKQGSGGKQYKASNGKRKKRSGKKDKTRNGWGTVNPEVCAKRDARIRRGGGKEKHTETTYQEHTRPKKRGARKRIIQKDGDGGRAGDYGELDGGKTSRHVGRRSKTEQKEMLLLNQTMELKKIGAYSNN